MYNSISTSLYMLSVLLLTLHQGQEVPLSLYNDVLRNSYIVLKRTSYNFPLSVLTIWDWLGLPIYGSSWQRICSKVRGNGMELNVNFNPTSSISFRQQMYSPFRFTKIRYNYPNTIGRWDFLCRFDIPDNYFYKTSISWIEYCFPIFFL